MSVTITITVNDYGGVKLCAYCEELILKHYLEIARDAVKERVKKPRPLVEPAELFLPRRRQ